MRKWMAILLTAGLCAAGLLQWRGLKEYGGQIFYGYGEKAAPDRALLNQLARQEKEAGDSLPGMAAWSVEEGVEVIGVKTPCVLTFTKPAWDLRRPTLKGKLAAARAGITVIGDDGLPDIDKAKIGLKGSPTKVKKTFVPPRKSGGLKIREASNRESAEKLFQLLMKDRTIWEGDV